MEKARKEKRKEIFIKHNGGQLPFVFSKKRQFRKGDPGFQLC